jgi:two-component system nitrate/nitrite response regulator NarL
MSPKIRVIILDDHQSIIDGYLFRLSQTPEIEVVATITYGEELEATLKDYETDVLLLDVYVPTSQDNPNPYPILHLIPKVLQTYPDLSVLVISQHNQSTLIKAVMDAGASGYILKDDYATIQGLVNVVRSIAKGDIYLSKQAYQQLSKKIPEDSSLTARQQEALSLCIAFPDADTAELARRLGIAHSTMRNILSGAYMRLNVRNRAAAIAKVRQLGLITPPPPSVES